MIRLFVASLSFSFLLGAGAAPRARIAALPIYAAATAKTFGLFQPIALSPDGKYIAYTSCDQQRRTATGTPRNNKAYMGSAGCDIELTTIAGRSTTDVFPGADSGFAAWSPDGRYLGFMSDRDGTNQLYVWDRTTNRSHRVLSAPMHTQASPMWAQGGKSLLMRLSPPAKKIALSGPSSDILSAGPIVKGANVSVFRSAENLTASEKVQAKHLTTASPLLSLDYFKTTLALVDASSGASRVLQQNASIDECKISPNGRYSICGSPVGFSADNGAALLSDILLIDLDSGAIKTIARKNANASSANWELNLSWSPDSRYIAWVGSARSPADISSYDMKTGHFAISTFGTVPVGGIEPAGQAGSAQSGGIAWIPNSSRFVLIAVPGDWRVPAMAYRPATNALWEGSAGGIIRTRLSIPGEHFGNVFNVAGGKLLIQSLELSNYNSTWWAVNPTTFGTRKRYSEQAAMDSTTISPDGGSLAFFKESADKPQDIWLARVSPFSLRRMSDLNPFFDKYVLGKARLISWHTVDGLPLRGALMLPSDYVPGRRYPLVVYPYGSEYKSAQINNFGFGEEPDNNEDLQTIATRGFALLLPDAPVHTGTPMYDIAKTIMPGVDKAIALGYADPNRLGVMGHSYGGYTVMSLIAQTNRFRAAISRAGMSDWTAIFSEMLPDGTAYGIRQAETWYGVGGSPWQKLPNYISQSPFYRFNKVTTPVLIIHGTADSAVVPFNADMSFVALRHLHKDVAYAKYADVDHVEGTWPFPDQLDYMNRMVNWFNRYLCPNRKSETEC